MKRFIEGEDRSQTTLMPECLDDYVGEDNTVRVVDAFVEQFDLRALRFEGTDPAVTGHPAYHPAVLLKIYLYGYLNRIQSSRRLEREAKRNVCLRRHKVDHAPKCKCAESILCGTRLFGHLPPHERCHPLLGILVKIGVARTLIQIALQSIAHSDAVLKCLR